MRWAGQSVAGVVSDAAALPGLEEMPGLVRTVRTPEFAGVTFHEVMARSALNHVPATSDVPFRWTTDTLGWKGTEGGGSAAAVTRRVLQQARPGGIVLAHLGANPDDGTTFDADALPAVIDRIRAAGYDFVTLDALTGG